MRHAFARRVPAVATALLSLGLGACDASVTATAEHVELAGATLRITAADLLPEGLATSYGGRSFRLTTGRADIFATLDQLCDASICRAYSTVYAPSAAFATAPGRLGAVFSLPAEVRSAEVIRGWVELRIDNDLGFDPLRPNGMSGPYGYLIVRTSTVAGASRADTIRGWRRALPNGQTTTFRLPLPTGAYEDAVHVDVALSAPQGQPAPIDRFNSIRIGISFVDVSVTRAQVALVAQPVDAVPADLDLSGVVDRREARRGSLRLAVQNPFAASTHMQLEIKAQDADGLPWTLVRSVALGADAESELELPLSRDEIRRLTGSTHATLRLSGAMTGNDPRHLVTLSPAAQLVVATRVVAELDR